MIASASIEFRLWHRTHSRQECGSGENRQRKHGEQRRRRGENSFEAKNTAATPAALAICAVVP